MPPGRAHDGPQQCHAHRNANERFDPKTDKEQVRQRQIAQGQQGKGVVILFKHERVSASGKTTNRLRDLPQLLFRAAYQRAVSCNAAARWVLGAKPIPVRMAVISADEWMMSPSRSGP